MTNPVQQGCIMSSERTKVLVTDMSDTIAVDNKRYQAHGSNVAPTLNMISTPAVPNLNDPVEFNVKILSKKISPIQLYPAPKEKDDDESRIFLSISSLAQCGIFSGEWVLISGNEPKKSRLCKVFGIDVTITKVTPPPIEGPPVAQAVTIARVASPASMNKALQAVCLNSLKSWFEERERIVCKGDIISIHLNEDEAHLSIPDDDNSIQKHTKQPTTLAYFKVTSLEGDDTVDGNIHPAYFGSGRRIVPSQTQMIQTGVENSRIPIGHISHYYDFANKLPITRSASIIYDQLQELVTSSLHPLGRDLELSCNALFHGPRGAGKALLVKEVAEELGVHVYEFSVYDVVSDTDAKTEAHLRAKFDKAAALAPCIVLIRHMEGLATKSAAVESGQEPLLATVLQQCMQDINTAHKTTGYPVMVIATTGDIDALPSSILSCFRHEIALHAPDEATRLNILTNLLHNSPLAPDVSLSNIATQTAALLAKDLVDLVGRAGVLALQRVDHITENDSEESPSTSSLVLHTAAVTVQDIQAAGIILTAADFDTALGEARASYSDSIGAPKIPSVTWDDVGGMAHVKDDILDTIQLPLEHPELFGAGLKKRSGILLYGPPGTGKTLLAKAIATSCSLNFFSVKGPELLNMYIGESEANVRRVFQRARDAKPCVIFFDELDSVAPKRGEKGDSGGVMDRIVSQLLAELDGMSEGKEEASAGDVFVIGATNRPDLLDPALLRPGRKFRLHPDLDLRKVAERCPFHYTGADFYALCSDAMLKAMTRVANSIDDKVKQLNKEQRDNLPNPLTVQYYLSHLVTDEELSVQVQEIDFIKALEELIPSVSATELAHYSKVREKFEKAKDEEEDDEAKENDLKKERESIEAKTREENEANQKVIVKDSKGKGKQRAV
ncbi:P-loop containing nucleoside triphosphate hydrolase protein [Mycotypha africana]|uniref:P-loop containing nucleoside triphosphate hydrolase protein n=1 Tax=Mycotypha africana TaxID=64632 RepID=UPI002301BF5B|nr:P-loop containing nucleoside triphosphate hydrolase protein [Mycotypha africana]KAI8968503.1 P-loop containing nucleoside triphosphate hydrolase protein [Mycotypha africana]